MDHQKQQSNDMSSTSFDGIDQAADSFFAHSRGLRVATDPVIAASLWRQYPNLKLSIIPSDNCNLLAFANAGHASYKALEDELDADSRSPGRVRPSLTWKRYNYPERRMDGDLGSLSRRIIFGKYLYEWQGTEFIVYLVEGRDGNGPYEVVNFYVLSADEARADQLLLAAGTWDNGLHGQIWVYEDGSWQKNAKMFSSFKKASWDSVILDKDMKDAIIEDHLSFFRSRKTYARLRVPWKRGIIYHGPPGNGKTISIKATMNMLFNLEHSVPTLYVRTLASWAGPEHAVKEIFEKARDFAPCYLVFEDLDSIISDDVRSFFLNELDGLQNNDGIFMIGSTNHLDRLDPGIAKRPSRFDRKYYFPDPNLDQRVEYCRFWQRKLSRNKRLEFPDKLCTAIAEVTDKFSFAYMQEAFVAALLALARNGGDGGDDDGEEEEEEEEDGNDDGKDEEELLSNGQGSQESRQGLAVDDSWAEVSDNQAADGEEPDLDTVPLWVEIQKQIEILREGIESED